MPVSLWDFFLWDMLKCEIKGFTISYATVILKKRHTLKQDLRNQLKALEKILNEDNDKD